MLTTHARETLQKALDRIRATPGDWDQTQPRWLCPCCLLAHAAIQDGRTPAEFNTVGGSQHYAIVHLGLSEYQAGWLFDPLRTVADFDAFLASNGVIPAGGRPRWADDV